MDPKHEHSHGPNPDEHKPHGDKPVPPADPESHVDLGQHGAATNLPEGAEDPASSGISVIEWASLVEDDQPVETGSVPTIDSPSDADWLNHTLTAPPLTTEDAVVLEDADEVLEAELSAEDDEPTIVPGSASDISLDEPDVLADDLEVVRSAFSVDSSDSMDRMAKPPAIVHAELATPDSGVIEATLAEDVFEATTADTTDALDDDLVDISALGSSVSGVDLVDEPSEAPDPKQAAESSGVNLADEMPISDDLAAAMLTGGEGPPSDEPRSGRDLIAEEVESGVDLHKPTAEIIDDFAEEEAGQATAAASDPLLAGKVESAVIEAQLVEDVIHEDAGETVALGDSPKHHVHESSVVLNKEPPRRKGETDTEDMELGSASGNLVSADLDFANDPDIDAPASKPSLSVPIESEEVDFGSDDDIQMPAQVETPAAGDDDVLTEVETPPAAVEKSAKPAKKERARSGVLGWAGGGLVGAVVTAGLCGAAWFFGLLPDQNKPLVNNPPRQQQPVDKPLTFDAKLALLRNGDFTRASESGIDKIDENNPAELEARGEYRWLSYFQKQRVAGSPIKADDEAVTLAKGDFDKVVANAAAPAAAKADALFWTGHLQEMTNNGAAALQTYDKGATDFAADPLLKKRFDSAKIRVWLATPAVPAVGQLPPDERERQVLLALLLPVLQAEPAPKPTAETPEAGYDFWDAVGFARNQNFTEALKKLQNARDLHDKRRFEQLRKSQNPLSDPNEDIFLRACDDLKSYWQMQERLRSGGYLDAKTNTDPNKALGGLVDYVAGSAKWYQTQGDKLVAEKVITDPKDLEKGLDQLLAEHKTASADRERFAKAGAALVTAKVVTKPEDVEQGVAKLLADRTKADNELADLKMEIKTAQTEAKKEMDARVVADKKVLASEDFKKAVRKELVDGKVLEANASEDKVVPAIRDVVKSATTDVSKQAMLKLQNDLTQARAEVATVTVKTQAQLAQRWSPSDMLNVWLPLLDEHGNRELAAKALLDADRVVRDAEATPAQKARAEVVRGLALRHEEKYPEAKVALEKGRAALPKEDKTWHEAVAAALKDITNPGATYIARADTLQKQGKYDEALGALTKAIEALPQDKGNLVAKRSLVALEAARAKAMAKLTAQDPLVAAAQKDAKSASDAGSALGYYAAGRIAEDLGDFDVAVKNYREAVAHSDLTGDGSLYRIALARALLLIRADKPMTVGLLDAREPAMSREMLAIFLAFTLQPPLGQPSPNVEEANKLADEILKLDKAKVPYEVRAQALGIKGLWTEALRAYAEGLAKDLDRRHADELLYLIDNHPKLKGPDSTRIPNPLLAEAHYGAGIRQYFDKHYGDAEKEFMDAIKNDSQDARYHYFLGLSRLALNKDEANDDFAQGAVLEAKGRPSRAAVSTALERVQGPVRTIVNEAREKSR